MRAIALLFYFQGLIAQNPIPHHTLHHKKERKGNEITSVTAAMFSNNVKQNDSKNLTTVRTSFLFSQFIVERTCLLLCLLSHTT